MGESFFSAAEFSSQSKRFSLSVLPQCGACGLHKTCQSKKMPPSGQGKKRILIVGEAPGEEEDKRGIQFAEEGRSGYQLSDTLRSFDIDMRKDCWLTNSLICRPPNNEVKNEKWVDYCRPNLLNTIERLDPEVIILLGGRAVKSLIGYLWKEDPGGIKRWAGWQIPCRKPNAWVCPTFHPAYLLREKSDVLESLYQQHLADAVSLKGRPWDKEPPDLSKRVRTILDPDEAAGEVRKLLGTSQTLSFDFETNCLKPDAETSQIACCAISDGKGAISYPWLGAAITATREFLRSDVRKVGYNLKFEDRWSRAFGCRVRNWVWDGMLAAHALDCRKGITGLKFQSFVRFGMPDYDGHVRPYFESKEDGGYAVNRIKLLDWKNLLTYCGLDALLEFMVYRDQLEELNRAE